MLLHSDMNLCHWLIKLADDLLMTDHYTCQYPRSQGDHALLSLLHMSRLVCDLCIGARMDDANFQFPRSQGASKAALRLLLFAARDQSIVSFLCYIILSMGTQELSRSVNYQYQ